MTTENELGTLTPPVSAADHAEGLASAPVTLVEYGDYECPHCGAALPVTKALQREMGHELRFVFRNFPLREAHPHAQHAAVAAEAVGAHGDEKFWAMHDTLFEGGKFADRVRADFRSGVRSGVNGTPTFFINGVRYDGDWRDARTFVAVLREAAQAHA